MMTLFLKLSVKTTPKGREGRQTNKAKARHTREIESQRKYKKVLYR